MRPLQKAWSGAADASDGCMLHALVIRVHDTGVITVSSLVSAVNYLSFMLCCVDISWHSHTVSIIRPSFADA